MNIYFSGIGGVGLGPLAQMALDAGHAVTGSDREASLTTRELEALGIEVRIGEQTSEFLRAQHDTRPLDLFVYTAALSDTHPELVAARELGIPTVKRDSLLAQLIEDSNQKLIAVAGTHGKTTVTGMLIWTLQQLGVPVSYSVGSQLSFGPSGKFDPAAKFFVYECDEFDRNFLHFHPALSVIVSIDYDHPDTYPHEDDYKAAFRQFIAQSGASILWQQDADYIDFSGNETSWVLQTNEVAPLKLAGEHNRRNATLVLKAVERLGIAFSESSAFPAGASQDANNQLAASGFSEKVDAELRTATGIVEAFPGTIRRFERLADNLYSDYGHHPVEIAATLQLARELSDHVVLVYQPHQNVRQHEIREQYTPEIFQDADNIYWLPTYLSRENPDLEILTPAQLTTQLSPDSLHLAEFDDQLWTDITRHRDAGHLVLCMGAGSIDGWLRSNETIKKVANVLVSDPQGNLILQHRDNKPTINNPGMITGFGGAVESGETVRQAAARELREETNLEFSEDDLRFLTDIYQPSVNDGQPRWVSYFVLPDKPITHLEVYEGQGHYSLSPNQNLNDINLSDTVKHAIETYRR